MVSRVQLLDSDGIGRCGFILQYHDSPEKEFSGPEAKWSLVMGIKMYVHFTAITSKQSHA